MTRNLIFLLVATFFVANIYAQQPNDEPTLSAGDQAPAIAVAKWIKGKPATTFKNGTAYVVEFGATWCTPCVAAIPKLSSLAKKYANEVEVMSVFVMERMGNVATVEKFVSRHDQAISYSVAVDDDGKWMENNWLRAAGKNGVPYAFVLDKDGKIAWIGSDTNKLDSMISVVLAPGYSLSDVTRPSIGNQSNTRIFDSKKLFLLEGNGGNENEFAFRSVVSTYNGKIKAPNPDYITSWRFSKSAEYEPYRDRIQMIGVSLGELYYAAFSDTLSNQVYTRNMRDQYPDTVRNPHHRSAYGKWWHAPVLEVSDTTPFNITRKSVANKYNYSLKVPAGLGSAGFLQAAMQRDMMTYFGYDVSVETRLVPYWKLVVTDANKASHSLRSPGHKKFTMTGSAAFLFQGAETRDIIWMLGSHFGYGSYDYGKLPKTLQGAFIDQTGIDYKIDFSFDRGASLQGIQSYLQSVGLDLIRAWKPMKVVVIRDPGINN